MLTQKQFTEALLLLLVLLISKSYQQRPVILSGQVGVGISVTSSQEPQWETSQRLIEPSPVEAVKPFWSNVADIGRITCDSPGCSKLVKHLKTLINESADPCQDFYKFACGAYHPNIDLGNLADIDKAGLENISSTIIREVTLPLLRSVNLGDKTVPKPLKFAKRFYESCLNWDPTEAESISEVFTYLRTFADWPLFAENWNNQTFNPVQVVGRMQGQLSIPTIVTIEVDVDKKNNDKAALYLKPATFDHDQLKFNETIMPTFRRDYKRLIVRAFEHLLINTGATIKGGTAFLRKLAAEIVQFEADLSANSLPLALQKEDSPDAIEQFYNPFALSEMNTLFNSTKIWTTFFQEVFRNQTDGLEWLKDNEIIVTQTDYFEFLGKLYRKTPKRVIANYLMWRLLVQMGPFVGIDYTDLSAESIEKRRRRRFQYDAEGYVQNNLPNRRLKLRAKRLPYEDQPLEHKQHTGDCWAETEFYYPDIIGRLYVQKQFTEKKLGEVKLIIADVLQAAKDTLKQSAWLTETAKRRMLTKLNNIVANIGYPEWIFNKTRLEEEYEDSAFYSSESYFHNSVNLAKWSYEGLFDTTDRTIFAMPITTVNNAAYIQTLNAFTYPAGTLEFPFYDVAFPAVYNYAVTGFTAGHEIMHGFDNEGVLYDENGNNSMSLELGESWLLDGSNNQFKRRSDCFVAEFSDNCYAKLTSLYSEDEDEDEDEEDGTDSQHQQDDSEDWSESSKERLQSDSVRPVNNSNTGPFGEVCIDGDNTLGENLADYNGIQVAMRAFLEQQRRGRVEQIDLRLSGLERFTSSQLFFISYASAWCTPPITLLVLHELAAKTTHSPPDARVNELARNLPEFAAAFGCPKRSTMTSTKELCTMF